MRNPTEVLKSLESKACRSDYRYERLYRNLYNPQFFYLAYQRIYAKPGNMTAGTDGETIDGMGLERINRIIDSLKNHSYSPNPARRVYIEKKGKPSKKRPLGVPSFNDKLVQEVVRMILESIYEPTFSNYSHGFRPNRSCHTALLQLKGCFTGAKWFIEGDIRGFFDNIDHHILVNILRKRINDEYFLALLWKFLKAGYMEDWVFHNTYSGTPQGSIISPILSNIYLNELDRYMETYIKQFNKGKERAENPAYRKLRCRGEYLRNRRYTPVKWETLSDEAKAHHLKEVARVRSTMLSTPYTVQQDSEYRRLTYIRYADDWICGVIGSKAAAESVKADIKQFLMESLKLELSDEKTLITHARSKARFLGYDVTIEDCMALTKKNKGKTQRNFSGKIKLMVPRDKWQGKLIEYRALKLKYHKGQGYQEVFEPAHRTVMLHNDDLEIVKQYNAEIRGIYNYYRIADNASVLNDFYYVMKYSMFKTFAAKYQTRISVIRRKYGFERFGVKYQRKGATKTLYFYDEGFRQNKTAITNVDIDAVPRHYDLHSISLAQRLMARKCEWCGAEDVPLEMHHVRKLNCLKGTSFWERVMKMRNRKTMALCVSCHHKLHAGQLS